MSAMMTASTMGLSKVYILDKYFSELQKFWDTEKRLQGKTKEIDRSKSQPDPNARDR